MYGFRFTKGGGGEKVPDETLVLSGDEVCAAVDMGIDYTEWLVFGPGSKVTAFTGRSELGQGLNTVLVAIISQGLEISRKKVSVVMGDTELCPDDGPTTGSSSTRFVGWEYWLACDKIRSDVSHRAAALLGCDGGEVVYSRGSVKQAGSPANRISVFDVGSGETVLLDVDTTSPPVSGRQYVDLRIPNVNAKKIVTGTQKYVGDMKLKGMLYGAFLTPPYFYRLTKLKKVDLDDAELVDGVVFAGLTAGQVGIIGTSYTAVRNGLDAVKAEWSKPSRPQRFRLEDEVRKGAKLLRVVEQKGDVESGLSQSDLVLTETYTTGYYSQCPIETDTAVADVQGKEATLWVGTQHPFKIREIVARSLKVPQSGIHAIGMMVGGAFGGKISNSVPSEAALLSRTSGRPVKCVYSREDQFNRRSRYKEACVIDLTTGVRSDGRIIARRIDIHQDEGSGTNDIYNIPNVLTRLYKAKVPSEHATMRGTSYVQDVFAVESHVDEVAHSLEMDPLAFRRMNVSLPVFRDLLDEVGEMFGYGGYTPPADHGVGAAIVNHGGRELGAFIVEVAVDRRSGKVTVVRVCGAMDVGVVINSRTLTVGTRGAILWGIGYALKEETVLDGHRSHTSSLAEYKVPRFSDLPEIDIKFLNLYDRSLPRGCGEMPVVPTIPAIANAVRNAIGERIYSIPLTPEKVLKAIRD